MTDQHPITPPPELLQQWVDEFYDSKSAIKPNAGTIYIAAGTIYIATEAARWGADQELKACCEWLDEIGPIEIRLCGNDLRIDRRPKPQSLAEEALKALAHILRHSSTELGSETIRRALERLQELEGLPND